MEQKRKIGGQRRFQTGDYYNCRLGGSRGPFRILKKDGWEILMPAYEMPDNVRTGDTLRVFVFMDGKDLLKATIMQPRARVGEFAALKVKSITQFGAFLDWGIKKDLFVPARKLRGHLQEGDIAVVRLIPDDDGMGVIGSALLEGCFSSDVSGLKENQKVSLLVFGLSNLGFRVIIDNRCQGLLYKNEVFENLRVGDSRPGYIKKIREDGRIDAALQPQGYKSSSRDAAKIIMKALDERGGTLPLHDKSSPEAVKKELHMSKKLFKKGVGALFRKGKIKIEENGIRRISPVPPPASAKFRKP